jgi:hypothetical protein
VLAHKKERPKCANLRITLQISMSLSRGLRLTIVWNFLLLSAFATCAAQSGAPSAPAANPARPTVATPATLTPVGYFQFENGIQYALDSTEFSSRFGVNQVTKLTVHPRIQLILQSEPLVGSTMAGQHSWQAGGVSVGVQGVVLPGHETRPTVSVSYLRSIYSGPAPDIDIGSANQSALILMSDDLFGFHFDVNGIFNEQAKGVMRRAQFGQTLSVSHPLIKNFTLAGEIWHFTQPLLRSNTIGNLWAISYTARPNLVFDAGFNHGFNATSTRWEAFCGFTYLLPHRLWNARPRHP